MPSAADNKTCGICFVSVAAGLGQAIFTAECSHAFHFPCITTYLSNSNHICPICSVRWNNETPFCPVSEPEPICFNDDEPLPLPDVSRMAIDSCDNSHKVTIKAIPERRAVAASEFVAEFAVLVGVTAPSLSEDARSSQRAPIDIVTVLDVSGSMFGKKLALVKSAVHFVIDNLGVSDRISLVSFSDHARRMLPLCRMTPDGREKAKRAVDSLVATGGTNIVHGLKKGVQVLEERRYKNPVTTVLFLSDGNDTCNRNGYLDMLPATIPVHSFGFGSDHDPITMHAISDASGGTFSFVESYEMIQDAFAGCIGGILSVVTQELRLKLRSASHGVEMKSIPSGRYWSEVSNQGSEGLINVGELYADEEREFLINISIPVNSNGGEEESKRKSSLLDITCSYKDAISEQTIVVEGDLVEVRRPKVPSSEDLVVNLEIDRQRNRLSAAESIKQAQKMAEAGNLSGATKLLAEKRSGLMATAAAQAGDGMTKWLEGEMKETEMRMGSARMYQQSGRAYALAGMSSHANQRATTNGHVAVGGPPPPLSGDGCPPVPRGGCGSGGAAFRGYATRHMCSMVVKSREQKQQQQ